MTKPQGWVCDSQLSIPERQEPTDENALHLSRL